MAKCAYCDTFILFGGVTEGDSRFCNQKCQQSGALMQVARQVPDHVVRERLTAIHEGECPKCQKAGPIDVYTSHFVWSAVLLTSWSSKPQVCCRRCGNRAKIGGALGSAVLGWWGFPWGLIATPIQVGRNVVGLCTREHPVSPSPQLEKIVRIIIADEAQRTGASFGPPPLPTGPETGAN